MIYNNYRVERCPSKAVLSLPCSPAANDEALVDMVNTIIQVYQWQNLFMSLKIYLCPIYVLKHVYTPHLATAKQHLPSGIFLKTKG